MAMSEKQALSGRLTIELRERDGRLVESLQYDNLITTAGQTLVAQLFTGQITGEPKLAIAVGGGAAKETSADAALLNKLDQAEAKTQSVKLVDEGGTQKALAVVTASFPALGGNQDQLLREAGILALFTNRDAILYNRVTFPDITRTANLEMTLTWEVFF